MNNSWNLIDQGSQAGAARQGLALLASLLVSFAPGLLGGWATSRSIKTWYPTLDKPSWTPPGRVIAVVWNVLYTLLGISAWLVWRRADAQRAESGMLRAARASYLVQLGLNGLWSLVFFGRRSPLGGLLVIVPLWLSIAAWVRAAQHVSSPAGLLQLPYLGWVSFASLLNATIWWRNRR
jgi:translocator protein